MVDAWLGKGNWDVIHFNFGLHDLKSMFDGYFQVSPDDYERNLRRIVFRLKQTGAKLIFATTTPVLVHHPVGDDPAPAVGHPPQILVAVDRSDFSLRILPAAE